MDGQGQVKMDYSTYSIIKAVIQKKINWSGTRQGFPPSSLLFNTAMDVQPENEAKQILSNPSWKESWWITSTHKRCDLMCRKT